MNLVAIKITNFRGFRDEREIAFDQLTAFVGRNDSGKSTILEALEIFFNGGKLDFGDANVRTAHGDVVRIACTFSEPPATMTVDAQSPTSLAAEYLLNDRGMLEVAMEWPVDVTSPLPDRQGKVGKLSTTCVANHPTHTIVADLLQKKQADLKKLVAEKGIQASVNQTSNASMRAGLWAWAEQNGGLACAPRQLVLDKEDGKQILEQIRAALPAYELFKADRASTDEDAEVQDPMKLAVAAAISEVETELEVIKAKVRERAIDVAQRTIAKLHDFDSALAAELVPGFKAEPKWDSLFKLSLAGDDGIPVNKRGSGVRRLVLFSFFRAEVERRQGIEARSNVIYAVEEPETAQHPKYQRLVIEALAALAQEPGVQVVLTTHVPALISLVPPRAIRYIHRSAAGTTVEAGTDDVYRRVAADLGVLPDLPNAPKAKLALCVEGKHDIQFLRHMCAILRTEDATLIDITADVRVVTILLGGSTLQEWVDEQYLRHTGLKEFHIYDKDLPEQDGSFKYAAAAATVNARGNGDIAFLTTMREMENYLHADAITEAFAGTGLHAAVVIPVADHNDIEAEVRNAIGKNKHHRRYVKHWLNDDAAAKMTPARLRARGGHAEVLGWFQTIAGMLV